MGNLRSYNEILLYVENKAGAQPTLPSTDQPHSINQIPIHEPSNAEALFQTKKTIKKYPEVSMLKSNIGGFNRVG